MSLTDPPGQSVFEVSVIGPGRGECIVVHLGHNEWCVVDSCMGRGSSVPAAVSYLAGFGQQALEGVRLLIATHWHDDHIRGISSALERFPNAKFCCSVALQDLHFLKLVQLAKSGIQKDSGVREFGQILDLLMERKKSAFPANLVAPQWAIQDRQLLRLEAGYRDFSAVIGALSPSDGTVKVAMDGIGRLIPREGELQRRVPNRSPNHTSVALWVTVGNRRALLGADLEHTQRSGDGWVAVLESARESHDAHFFKVPHHGSSNADCAEIWQAMLRPHPICVITPFTSSGLPRSQDLDRLRQRTPQLYCTAPSRVSLPRRDNAVEKMMRGVPRTALDGGLGQVRVRWSAVADEDEPIVELFHGAYRA